jgi:site-specific recombinase XerD
VPGQIRSLLKSWDRSLCAAGRSPKTRQQYLETGEQFAGFLEAKGMPTVVADITREHVEHWLVELREGRRLAPSTVATRYKALRVFFAFLEDEGELAGSRMVKMSPPQIPEVPVPVLDDDALKRLLGTVSGSTFDARRDQAIIRLFVDTGMRRAELAGLRLGDLDMDLDVAHVVGKGKRPRACPFGAKTSQALSPNPPGFSSECGTTLEGRDEIMRRPLRWRRSSAPEAGRSSGVALTV